MPEGTCQCGAPLPYKGRGRRRKFCPDCVANGAYVKRAQPVAIVKTCQHCAAAFVTSRSGKKFCTEQCQRDSEKLRDYRPEKLCVECGKPFKAWKPKQRCCSRECADKTRNESLRLPPRYDLNAILWWSASCRLCAKSFPVNRHGRLYCSDSCAWKWYSLGETAHDVLTCVECGDTWVRWTGNGKRNFCTTKCGQRHQARVTKRKRSKRIRTCAKRESISLPHLAERDGWRCHLCGGKVSRDTWSMDHLIPLSAGGDHTYANVALAHHRCNTLRGARGLAQLRLMG